MYFQPFAELIPGEKPIPKIEVQEQIFRCKFCAGYINNKFEIKFNKSNKRIITCNLCQNENELDPSKPGVKSEYFNSNPSDVLELTVPTVDFNAPPNLKHTVGFQPHYIFLIDISRLAKEISFATYVSKFIKSALGSKLNRIKPRFYT